MKYSLFILLMIPAVAFAQTKVPGVNNICPYDIDDKPPTTPTDKHVQGIWKMAEDTNAYNYFIVENKGEYEYSITYMNKGGSNRGLEHFTFYFSEVNGIKFINVQSWDLHHTGWVFLKVDNISAGSWDITAHLVISPLKDLKSSKEVRALLEKNLNNPSFYGKELHFRKKFEFNSFR